MTTDEEILQTKVALLRLADQLGNVSQACKVMGYSRDSFYRFKKLYDAYGEPGLQEISRKKPILKNRIDPDIEEAVIAFATEQPDYGQLRVSNELKDQGIFVSPGGVRLIWQRHNLETFQKRIKALEEKGAVKNLVFTVGQPLALEKARIAKEAKGGNEAIHPGYPGAQETYSLKSLKWVGKTPFLHLISLFSRSTWVAFGYLTVLTVAESLVAFDKPLLGLILHGLLLAALLLFASLENNLSYRQFILAMSLGPLIRLLSLVLPLTIFPIAYWYMIVGIPLFIAAYLIMRLAGITRQMAGLIPGKFPMQLLVGLSGFFLGYIEYRILRPAPLVPAQHWESILLAALILLIFTGLLEEFIFRGLQQSTAIPILGRYAIPFVAAVFAVLHLGYRSALDVLFVFGVALFFGWIVHRSGSILGVSLSHGITNISLYLIFPLLIIEPAAPQGLLLPSRSDPNTLSNPGISQMLSIGSITPDSGTSLQSWPRQVSTCNSSTTACKYPTDSGNACTPTPFFSPVNRTALRFLTPPLPRPPPVFDLSPLLRFARLSHIR